MTDVLKKHIYEDKVELDLLDKFTHVNYIEIENMKWTCKYEITTSGACSSRRGREFKKEKCQGKILHEYNDGKTSQFCINNNFSENTIHIQHNHYKHQVRILAIQLV